MVRNLIAFVIVGIMAVCLGFFCFDEITLFNLYRKYALYFIAVAFSFWIFSLVKAFLNVKEKDNGIICAEYKHLLVRFFSFHKVAFILSILLMVFGVIRCRPDFRILADETNLLSVSQSIYEFKEPLIYISTINSFNGGKEVLNCLLDKRPIFFPFLVSIIHSAVGYKPENIFVFNFCSSVIALFLFYYLIHLKYGRFWGICGMVCLSAYPLFIIFANSAGFEVFNLTCSLLLFLFAYNYLVKPDALRGEILLSWLPLISQSRYESVLSVFIFLPLFFYKLPKSEYAKLSYKFYVFPLLFLPIAWQRMAIDNASIWQVDSLEDSFGLKWLIVNTQKAFEFFFFGIEFYGVITFLSFFALIGLYFFIKEVAVNSKSNFLRPVCITVSLFYLLHAVARFMYCLADLTDVTGRRLGIIFLPMIVYLGVVFLVQLNNKIRQHKIYYSVLCAFLLFFNWSDTANLSCVRDLPRFWKFKKCREYLNDNYSNKNDFLIMTSNPNYYTPLGYNSISFDDYNKYNEKIKRFISDKKDFSIISFQYLYSDTLEPICNCVLPEGLTAETVLEEQFTPGFLVRISKCYLKPEDTN